jgi:hypothetical protein
VLFRSGERKISNCLIFKFLFPFPIKTVQNYEKVPLPKKHNLFFPPRHTCHFGGGDICGAVQWNDVRSKSHLWIVVVYSNMVHHRSQCIGVYYPTKNAQTTDGFFAARFVFGNFARGVFDVRNQQTGYSPAADGETG